MSNGQLINHGRPYDLLQDKKSILFDLVHKLGKNEEERLFEIAKEHVFCKYPAFSSTDEDDKGETEAFLAKK